MRKFNKHKVVLTPKQRKNLQILAECSRSARSKLRARVLLLLDADAPDAALTGKEAAGTAGITMRALREIKKRFYSEGLASVIGRKAQETPSNNMPFDYKALEKQVLAVVCDRPPEELTHWSLRLIKKRLIDDGCVEKISAPTINKVLRNLSVSLNATPLEIRRQIRARGLIPRGVQVGKGVQDKVKVIQYTAEPQRNVRHVWIVNQGTQGT